MTWQAAVAASRVRLAERWGRDQCRLQTAYWDGQVEEQHMLTGKVWRVRGEALRRAHEATDWVAGR